VDPGLNVGGKEDWSAWRSSLCVDGECGIVFHETQGGMEGVKNPPGGRWRAVEDRLVAQLCQSGQPVFKAHSSREPPSRGVTRSRALKFPVIAITRDLIRMARLSASTNNFPRLCGHRPFVKS
jgi:hypothetical protein